MYTGTTQCAEKEDYYKLNEDSWKDAERWLREEERRGYRGGSRDERREVYFCGATSSQFGSSHCIADEISQKLDSAQYLGENNYKLIGIIFAGGFNQQPPAGGGTSIAIVWKSGRVSSLVRAAKCDARKMNLH